MRESFRFASNEMSNELRAIAWGRRRFSDAILRDSALAWRWRWLSDAILRDPDAQQGERSCEPCAAFRIYVFDVVLEGSPVPDRKTDGLGMGAAEFRVFSVVEGIQFREA